MNWHFYPERFSSYEEYVNYLKEKGFAFDAPEGTNKTEQNMEREFILTESIVQNILRYCEDKQVYDKLGKYGDFYYKLKKATQNENIDFPLTALVSVYVE